MNAIFPTEYSYWNSSFKKTEPLENLTSHQTIKKIAVRAFDHFRFGCNAAKNIFFVNHFAQMVFLPVKGVEFVQNCASFPKIDRQKQIDAVLKICNNFREIIESAGSFAVVLERVKAIPSRLLEPLATPFVITLSALSIFSVASNVRTCMKVKRLMHELNQAEEKGKIDGKLTHASYKAMLNVLENEQFKDENFISNIFNTTQDQLKEVFAEIDLKISKKLSSNNSEEIHEGQKILENSVKSLKGRVKQNIFSSAFAITSSVVNIFGTAMLLALPIAPLGWVVLGVKMVIDLGRLIHHKIVEYQFAKDVDLKRTKWEWMTC